VVKEPMYPVPLKNRELARDFFVVETRQRMIRVLKVLNATGTKKMQRTNACKQG
jgi:hypothetical protein